MGKKKNGNDMDTEEVEEVIDNSEEGMLDQYSNLLESISLNPFNLDLHLQHIFLTKELGLDQELNEARQMFIQYFPMPEAMWLKWIADKKDLIESGAPDDLSLQMELIELYKRSILDYLSIPLLLSYSQFFITNYYAARGLLPPPEEDEDDTAMNVDRKIGEPNPVLGALFDVDAVRAVREEVLSVGGLHLTQSPNLWDLWRRFELDIMKENGIEESAQLVNQLYLARLAVPHIEIEDTFSAYSSFVTKFFNPYYGKMLPKANKIYTKAHALVETREFEERKLKKGAFSETAYLTYIQWELDVKVPNVKVLNILFERAIKDHPLSLTIWESYLAFSNRGTKPNPDILPLLEKAVKSIPSSGSLWATYLRSAERNQLGIEAIDGIFSRAMSSGLLDENMEELILVFEARAGYHRREVEQILMAQEDPDESLVERILEGLVEGIRRVNDTTEDGSGDPQLRLEKHLIRMYERFDRETEASALWASLTAARPTSYAVWYGRADFETRAGNFSTAHTVYADGCGAKNLDYPEYLLEAWLNFEKQNGTLIDLEFTLVRIKKQKKGIQARREREALAMAQSAPAPVASISTSNMEAESTTSTDTPSIKRERSPAVEAPPPKRAKTEKAPSTAVKRDRENSTVFIVAPLEAQLSDESIKQLFSDCGPIRECTLKTIESQSMGMVEFMEKESVGAAQTKDKKRINEVEVDVHIAWESCLFVTNFPVGYDKAAVEGLFSKYGTIFDTRWPSKTYKDTRRFCYVQFTSPQSAQAALELHGTTLDNEGIKLIVYISDPQRKKGRTDAGANNKELYVQGLSKYVKETDLRTLFEPFGTIKSIRVMMDDKEECKGFAFVEFEDEASALKSLELNNFELKKRRMSVVIAQARAAGIQNPREAHKGEKKYEVDARSLKIRGIIAGTEEAIVQQDLEKHAIVKFVKMVAGETEAVVEFENGAEAGKVLLIKDTITIAGANVEIFAEGTQTKKSEVPKASSGPAGTFMPRQTARGGRGRGGLGSRGRGGIGSSAASARPATSSTPSVSATTSTSISTESKSQDDFRALMNKK